MSIKLVASDLDGTIIDKKNNISPKNFKAIEDILKKNVNFAICTGKSYSVTQKFCKQFNASYGIFGNGTQIIDFKNNREIYRKVISKNDLLFCVTLAKRYNFHVHFYTDHQIITEKLEYMDLRNYKLKDMNSSNSLEFIEVKDIISYIEDNNLPVYSAIITTEISSLELLENLLKINKNIDYTFINKRGRYKDRIIDKDYEYINVTPLNVDKYEAIKFLASYLHIKNRDILAIGDNVNDLKMVKNSGIGIAVKDSYRELKEVASYITSTPVSDGAFAEAMNLFVLND